MQRQETEKTITCARGRSFLLRRVDPFVVAVYGEPFHPLSDGRLIGQPHGLFLLLDEEPLYVRCEGQCPSEGKGCVLR